MTPESRAILLTPAGAGAIAVVRITGPRVLEFLRQHFDAAPQAERPVHGKLVDRGEAIDDAVVVLGADGSFADLNLHGGAWVVKSVLALAGREGFHIVESTGGVVSAEAMDAVEEIEREILTHLPLATTNLAIHSLLAQRNAWRKLASSPIDPSEAARIVADRSLRWLLRPPRVAIVGPANAGKSTLANQLFAQERSITADVPGTTRDWVGEIANLGGLAVELIDTPGLRETVDPIESLAIQRSGNQIRNADLLVLLLDASRALEPEQAPLLQRFENAIIAANKCDLPHQFDIAELRAFEIVATTGHGVDRLIDAILARFDTPQANPDRVRCWTQRQIDLLHSVTNAKCPGP